MVRVKICGITNSTDARTAMEAGADSLGFMFYRGSPRHVALAAAGEIFQQLPESVMRVGVFVNPTVEEVRAALAIGVEVLQFHGEETPDFCRQFRQPCLKAFRIQDAASLAECPAYSGMAWLLDSYVPGQRGGTGAAFNWNLAREAKNLTSNAVYLAGGLTPANVAEAVRQVRPYAVDVSSGVESAPGKKDKELVRAFIQAAKGA